MRYYFLCLVSAVLMCASAVNGTSAILTGSDVANGRVNAASTQFNGSVDYSDGSGAAVRYLLTGDESAGQDAKVQLLRYVLAASDGLPDATGSISDESSKALVDALIIIDILSGSDILTDTELAGMRNSLDQVIGYYLDPAVFAWDHDEWSLGVPAVRISTACILYAFNFTGGSEAERYLDHGMRYFRHNLLNSVDDFGAWLPDSPGDAAEAVYDMIIAAKALKNKGFQDNFANPRFRNLLIYHMRLMPPQQCPSVKGEYMLAGIGATDPSANYSRISVLAAKDLYSHFPDEASYLMWYWNQCGNPVDPLGVLFIDPSIPYMRPDSRSGVPGGGAAILRNNQFSPTESNVIVSFGNEYGMPDRNRRDHADHGDFSIIWDGIPLIIHESAVPFEASERLLNTTAWRHNTVIPYRSGISPVIGEAAGRREIDPAAAAHDSSGTLRTPADIYPDGIRQYMSTSMVDYVAGDVRLARRDMPAPYHYRHLLFLKPDALLVWDQVESPSPLEWGLWMPVDRMHREGNVLQLFNDDGYELHALFAGENELDAAMIDAPKEKTADWPLVMSTRYGTGSIALVTADLFRGGQIMPGMTGTDRMLIENLLHLRGNPRFIGLLAGVASPLADLLDQTGLPYERMRPEDFSVIGTTRFGTVVIDDSLSATDTAVLNDHIPNLQRYVHDGGRIVWCVRSPRTLRPATPAGPGTLPVTLDPAGSIIDLNLDTDLASSFMMNPSDSLWTNRQTISRESLLSWIASGPDGVCTAVLPAAWSDRWAVHASVNLSIPVQAYAHDAFGIPKRISVRKQSAKDFFALLLPRRTGQPYRFNVKQSGPGYVVIESPAATWEIYTGKTGWTDANLSVRITRNGTAEEFYAFDCTWADFGIDKIFADKPVSIHYSARDDKGILTAAESVLLSFHMGDIRVHAGEVTFRGLKTEISLDRSTFVSTIAVTDTLGEPVPWVRIDADSRFAGKTGPDGTLPLRWYGHQPEVTITHRGAAVTGQAVPGKMIFEIQEAQ